MSSRSKPKREYQTHWSWPEDVEEWLAPQLEGISLHICCGVSQLGMIRLDTDPTVKPDIIADALALPFRPQIFDTVLSDPPWFMAWDKRPQFGQEMRDVTTPGGKVIFNCNWLVKAPGLELSHISLGVPKAAYRSMSIFQFYNKIMSQFGWSRRKKFSLRRKTPISAHKEGEG